MRRLGDFTLEPRVLVITGLALAIGGLSALVAWCLLRLIGLTTNLPFYHRAATGLVAPGRITTTRSWFSLRPSADTSGRCGPDVHLIYQWHV